jgi:hypothetical protein
MLKFVLIFQPYVLFKQILTAIFAYSSASDALTALRIQESSIVGTSLGIGVIAYTFFV